MKVIDIHQHLMMFDPTGDVLVRYLDTNGIEKAVVIGCTYYCQSNDTTRKAVRRHPDRLIGGAYVDPRDLQASLRTVREYHQDGFKVIKMFPCFGFYPDDPAIYPVYALMEELGMVLLNHAGGVPHDDPVVVTPGFLRPEGVSIKYDLPWHYDAPARCFPKLTFILAHMGLATWNLPDIFYQVSRHPNLYLDTSCGLALRAMREIARVKNQYIWPLDFSKLLWGHDGYSVACAEKPAPRVQAEQQAVREMVQDEATLSLIMYENAKRLLALA